MGYYSALNQLKRFIKGEVVYFCDALGIYHKSSVDEALKLFCPEVAVGSPEYKEKRKDIILSAKKYGITESEYFLFDFPNSDKSTRTTFIGKTEKSAFTRFINKNDDWELFHNKYETYKKLKSFYHREVDEVQDDDILNKATYYVEKYGSCILKPSDLSCGQGVIKLNKGENIQQRINGINSGLIEEYIHQNENLAKFHPSSVNTVRITTYLKNGNPIILYALFRMGANNSVVDNAGAGGIIAALNTETGIIETLGYRENGMTFEFHPDTGVKITGAQIPNWTELLDTVKELATLVPTQKLIGWDMTLTDKGWTVIEGNNVPAFTGIQMCKKTGIRQLIADNVDEYRRFI